MNRHNGKKVLYLDRDDLAIIDVATQKNEILLTLQYGILHMSIYNHQINT